MWFQNPIRKRIAELLAEKRQIEQEIRRIQDEECSHNRKTVVTNLQGIDWNSCEDCGKLLGH